MIIKQRDPLRPGVVVQANLVGDVKGADAIIVDDMVLLRFLLLFVYRVCPCVNVSRALLTGGHRWHAVCGRSGVEELWRSAGLLLLHARPLLGTCGKGAPAFSHAIV